MSKKTVLVGLFCCSMLSGISQTNNIRLATKDTITDPSIVYPSEMERNYDQSLIEWNKEMKLADDCNIKTDVTVIYPDSVYIKRLYALPTTMEMVFNPVVKSYIEMYAGRRRNLVSYMLGEGKFFYPMFEEALDRENMPLELKYLPVIESALNPIARSRVGASGLWQFMTGTGRMYDLEINSLVDERCDPLKSTEAAVKYLKDLYNIYGDWNLVIAAYNCGPGNVNKAIRRSGGQTDYWTIYPYLPRETRGYVPAFIAATYIMNFYEEHNICPAVYRRSIALDTLYVNNKVHFQQIADVINIPIEEIRSYNPQFKKDIIPGDYKQYTLTLPIQKVSTYIEKQDAIFAYKTNELLPHRKVAGLDVVQTVSTNKTHKVKRGETLASIAQKYGVTVNQLKKWNGLRSNSISVGRRLTVGVAPPKKIETPKEEPTQSLADTISNIQSKYIIKTITKLENRVISYKIKKGDNLAKIAEVYDVSASDIKQWNNLKTNNLIVGRSLKIHKQESVQVQDTVQLEKPQISLVLMDSTYLISLVESYLNKIERDESTLPIIHIASKEDNSDRRSDTNTRRIIYHKVRIGETIPQIAQRYNVSKDDIINWNKLSSSIAKVGQRLLIRLPEKKDDSKISQTKNT